MSEPGFDSFDPKESNAGAGRYRPIRRLAIGGMAEIYLAQARSLHGFQKLVVLKRVLPQYGENRQFMRMFLDEARLASTLDHPNIVHVYDIGGHNGEFFFAMEYVHGQSLQRVMRQITDLRRWLPLEHALAMIIGTCAGLHYAHEKVGHDGAHLGIVHRDVSPPNILVSYDGAVKVADFGIAKANTASTSTAVGTLKGKIPYMSPEQCRSEPLDRRSDVFSIGILLYELTVGRRLFHAETEVGIMHKIVSGAIPPPSEALRGYPRELEQVVLRALAADVQHRYPTARALQYDLEEFAREYKIAVSSARLAAFMEELFDEGTRRWPDVEEGAHNVAATWARDHRQVQASGGLTQVAPVPAETRGGVRAPAREPNPSSTGVGPTPTPTPPPRRVSGVPAAIYGEGGSATGSRTTTAPVGREFAAIDAALGRMLDSDGRADGLTAPLGEPVQASAEADDWFGLDSLELEELYPAKHGS